MPRLTVTWTSERGGRATRNDEVDGRLKKADKEVAMTSDTGSLILDTTTLVRKIEHNVMRREVGEAAVHGELAGVDAVQNGAKRRKRRGQL
jgi:hypothetical protein